MTVHSSLLTFPYHDPQGNLNALLMKTLPVLQHMFTHVCVSATPPTVAENNDFLNMLEQAGCTVFRNKPGSAIGDHLRGALATALSHARTIDMIHYVYVDRLVFARNTDYAENFRDDVLNAEGPLTLWERSEKAWATHPNNYRDIEKAANIFGKHLLGEEIELGSCGMSMRADLAAKVLPHSKSHGMEAATEWIFLSYMYGIQPSRKQVDWLAWEDPFIEGKGEDILKKERENSAEEKQKRLSMNAGFAMLAADPRFAPLLR